MSASTPPRRDRRPRLLLVGSGSEHYRRYLLSSIAEAFDVWIASPQDPGWTQPFRAGHVQVSPSDAADLIRSARDLHAACRLDGVLCWDESLILPAAHVAEALSLPGPSVDAVSACRDKHVSRRLLDADGVPQARSFAVRGTEAVHRAARTVGFPLVVKPRGLGGSRGVVRVDDVRDLDRALQQAAGARYPGVPWHDSVLVEEYLDGPEISVDGIVVDGRYQAVFLARKQIGLAPYFEETGHDLLASDPLMNDGEVQSILDAAHRALGFRHGWTHSELRLTARGPRLVEINGRLGGDLIPYLGQLATGVDPGLAAATLAIGETPAVRPTRNHYAAIRFVYPDHDCRVEQVRIGPLTDLPASVRMEAAVLAPPGATLRLPPRGFLSRLAYVLAAGPDAARSAAALNRATAEVGYAAHPLLDSVDE